MGIYRVFGLSVLTCLFSTLFLSCHYRRDWSGEIRVLDSLGKRVDSIPGLMASIDADTLDRINKIMEQQLTYIQQNYTGFMRDDIGKATSTYKNLKKIVKTTHTQIKDMDRECAVTREQLSNLRQALSDGATEDAVGNKMDDEYVQKALAREKEEAGKLIRSVPLIQANAIRAVNHFGEQYPRIRFLVDSIPLKNVEAAK